MGYSIRREHVTQNLSFLEALSKAMKLGESFDLPPNSENTVSQIEFQVRNVLKSAEAFPEYGFAHLQEIVTISTRDPASLSIRPKYGFSAPREFDELAVLDKLLKETKDFVSYSFRLDGEWEDFLAALGSDWRVSKMESSDGVVEASFERLNAPHDVSDAPFSILSRTNSKDVDAKIRALLNETSHDE